MSTAIKKTVDGLAVSDVRTILGMELKVWKNTRYQATLRLRVAEHLNDDPSVIDALRNEVTRCEKAIMFVEEQIAELDEQAGE